MLKVNKNFALLEEEGKIINLEDISFVNIYGSNGKFKLSLMFKQMDGFDILYDTLEEAEQRLHDIFKAIGVMK
jgi:hypothetical protein